MNEDLLLIYPYLKKRDLINMGPSVSPWRLENLKDGLQYYFDTNGRYPTAGEIDKFEYLPTSRHIQRQFGGLLKLRELLGLDVVNFSVGINRSRIASEINTRGNDLEKDFESVLTGYFGEYFVHAEKPLYFFFNDSVDISLKKKLRADFFIYARKYSFCIDIFHAQDLATFKRIVNFKEKNYSYMNIDVFLVNFNELSDITDDKIEVYISQKKNRLEPNVKLMNISKFLEVMKKIEPLKAL